MRETELTALEQERYDIIRSCIDGDITNKEASVRLGLKIRQVQIKREKGGKGYGSMVPIHRVTLCGTLEATAQSPMAEE